MAAASLGALPNEILTLITGHLGHARDVRSLALTSKRLGDFTRLDGWKAFLKGRFGLVGLDGLDSDARNAVHGLSTLYRNWHRKAFLARHLEPMQHVTCLSTWRVKTWTEPEGQTMGYQPSIDSYSEFCGSWSDRREVVAWSAGTQIAMRIKEREPKSSDTWEEDHGGRGHGHTSFGPYGHAASWYTYKIPRSWEGRDDITDLKLLRPHQKPEGSQCIAFGTASGTLSLMSVDPVRRKRRVQNYYTNNRSIGSLTTSPSENPLIAAILGDSTLALYPVDLDAQPGQECQHLGVVDPVIRGARGGRLWSCNFISHNRVAVGMGPSFEPIQIYEASPSGFNTLPLRSFSLDAKFWDEPRAGAAMRTNSSVYPIIPLPSSSSNQSSPSGHLFLSGGYDGIVRLHDMRSPHGFETMFWDVTNDSTVYSLAAQGLERVVVGTSMHSMLKVFDLRLSGSHAYHTISLPTSRSKPKPQSGDYAGSKIVSDAVNKTGTKPVSGGWNLFLSPRNARRSRNPRTDASPVYSISIPSSISPFVYTGQEGVVMSLDFLSIADKHPDPIFAPGIRRFPDSGIIDIKKSYNPNDDVLNLGMYEQGDEQALGMQLMVQEGLGMGVEKNVERRDLARFKDLDERWKDPSDEDGRWTRGQLPQDRRGGGRQRGGRGRGRGRGRRG